MADDDNDQVGNNDDSEKNGHRIEPILAVSLSLFAVLCIVLAVFLTIAFKARSSGVIYPNVSVQGINVGGITPAEAAIRIGESDIDPYHNKSVTVKFKDFTEADFTLTSEEVGLALNLDDIAKTASNYGHSGNLLQNAVSYIKCEYFGGADISVDTDTSLNKELISARSLNACEKAQLEPVKPGISIGELSLTVTTGQSGRSCDAKALADMICDSFSSGSFEDVVYTPIQVAPGEVSLEDAYSKVHKDAENSVYSRALGGVTDEKAGISFDLSAAYALIKAAGEGKSVTINYFTVEPTIRKADFDGLLFRDVLSQSTTTLAYNPGRTTNVSIGASCINGVLLNPGEVFSFNSYVGPYTEAAGYQLAAAYLNGNVVQELGGGVCQIASGIYYCTLYANLEVVYRSCHLYVPSYIPYGLDATVSYGGLDYKFKNNTNYPIKILCEVVGSELSVKFIGTNISGNHVDMECITVEENPYQVFYEEDPSLEAGTYYYKTSGFPGCTVDTFRKVYDAGGKLLLREFEDESVYTRRDVIIVRGPSE